MSTCVASFDFDSGPRTLASGEVSDAETAVPGLGRTIDRKEESDKPEENCYVEWFFHSDTFRLRHSGLRDGGLRSIPALQKWCRRGTLTPMVAPHAPQNVRVYHIHHFWHL